jgi:hypothetical protein
MISLRALTFFKEGDLNSLDKSIKKKLVAAVESVDIQKLTGMPLVSPDIALK